MNFMEVRANVLFDLFSSDGAGAGSVLEDRFPETTARLFPGNPMDDLADIKRDGVFVSGGRATLAVQFRFGVEGTGRALAGDFDATIVVADGVRADFVFPIGESERTTIFSEPDVVEASSSAVAGRDPGFLRIDAVRHYHRPSTRLPAGGQNHIDDPSQGGSRSYRIRTCSSRCR